MNSAWLDRSAYPFESHYLDVDGGRMHYIDEGAGPPIVFVHGTPTWSWLYRDVIKALRGTHRCIAADNIGFGLSDKPVDWGYRFSDHTRNLGRLIDHLGLERFTLVVHDLGGPIGLGYAVEHPERIERLVAANTTMWPLTGEFAPPPVAKLFNTALGRWMYLRLNVSPQSLLPMLYGDRKKLTPEIHRHYLAPFPTPNDRHGLYAYVGQLTGDSPELAALWARHERIAHLPTLLIWGMRDSAFGPKYLERWRRVLPQAQVLELPMAGHLVFEEEPEQVQAALRSFVAEGVTV